MGSFKASSRQAPLRRMAGSLLRRSLGALPIEARDHLFRIVRATASPGEVHRLGSSIEGALQLARDSGFQPQTIVDIGAYVGDWGRMARQLFPAARVLMIDGNPENDAALNAAAQSLAPGAQYFIALLGSEVRPAVTLFQHGTGTSVLRELTTFKPHSVQVPMTTLDSLLQQESIQGPMLLKLDVQGFELEVLRGGANTLQEAELVVLEVSTLPYNENAPLLSDVVDFMATAGFAVFDFCGQTRRIADQALFQLDVIFARIGSELRRHRKFLSHEP